MSHFYTTEQVRVKGRTVANLVGLEFEVKTFRSMVQHLNHWASTSLYFRRSSLSKPFWRRFLSGCPLALPWKRCHVTGREICQVPRGKLWHEQEQELLPSLSTHENEAKKSTQQRPLALTWRIQLTQNSSFIFIFQDVNCSVIYLRTPIITLDC